MSVYPVSRLGKLLAFAIAFFLIGFLGLSYFLGVSYGDDRTQVIGSHPIAAETATAARNLDPEARLEMQIRFALRHKPALENLLVAQQTPSSASYHKWLKTGEFFKRFGPTKPEVRTVAEWLSSEGFEVKRVSAGYLEFSGSVALAERTFAVTITRYGAADAYANTTDPLVPYRFASVIGSVTGMDNMVHAIPVANDVNTAFQPAAIIGVNQAFSPSDFHTFYNENPGPGRDGNGDCIAIVGTSDFLDSTMTAYTNQFGLSPISYTRELHGADPGITGAEVEAELDLQWAHAAAPAASIAFHMGGNLVDDIAGAVNDNQCGAISISYGFCGPSSAFISGIVHPLFQQAAAQGQSVFVSSGDQGAAGLGYNPITNSCVANNSPSVNEMSADPYVTSVGGTQFTPTYAGGNDHGYSVESTWNDASGASGGGVSEIFSKPDYQTGPGVPNDGARDVPDVSLMASPNSPGAFFGHDMSGTAQVVCCVGGTSLSAPIWAGFSRVVAQLIGQTRLGNFNTIIYQLANQQYATTGFHDVTNGNNSFNSLHGFDAGPGYDLATGWGTVDFDVFANAANHLLNPNASPSPTPTATPAATPSPTPSPTPTGGVLSVPSAINFPSTATGRPGTMKTLLIKNRSRTSPLSVDVGTLAAPFAVSGARHYSVAPRSSIPIGILFSPTNSGTARQFLQITSGDPKQPSVIVKVVAIVKGGKLSIPARVALNASVSAIVTKTVMLRNSGAGTLSGIAQSFDVNSPFTLLGGPVSFWLAPGETQSVTIQFQAASAGTTQGNLMVAMVEPPGTASINVVGSVK